MVMPIISKRKVAALALAGSVGLISACDGPGDTLTAPNGSLAGQPGATGSGPASMPGMDMSSSASTPASAPAVVSGTTVAITNFAFSPASLAVKAGTKVTWTNKDGDAHTVTSTGSGGPLNSAAMNTNDTFSFTFTTPGTFNYLCTIHPFMTAVVTVTP
jgi:plastocyanin